MLKQNLLEWRFRDKSPLLTFLHLYRGDWLNLVLATIVFTIKHSGVWLMPFITANLIDIAANPDQHSTDELLLYILLAVFVFVQNIPTNYLFVRLLSNATRGMESRLRAALAQRFQQLSMDYFARNSTGILQTKILRDVEILQTVTTQAFNTLPAAITTLFFAVLITVFRVPEFLIFYALVIPVTVLVVYGFRAPMEQRNHDFRIQVQNMSASIIEMLNMIPVTRAHGVEDDELQRVGHRLEDVRQEGRRLDDINGIFGSIAWVSFNLFEVVCLAVAVYGVYSGTIDISVGEIVMLTGFFRSLTNSVLAIVTIFPELRKGIESIHSIGEVLESPDLERNEGRIKVKSVGGQFSFRAVNFNYPDTQEHALQDITLDVQPNENIAFVGPSGAGKSTLLSLIIGFIRPSSGHILLDGQDMNNLDLRTFRRFVSVVPQETVLFDGTIRDNILYGVKRPTEERLQDALRFSNADEFIDALPEGIETRLGENGARLSGGQRQRIAIARALIRDPRVLILDEATSALDNQSEKLIQHALEHLMQNRTTFVVAHRLSTVQNADRIVVMQSGSIVEVGPHDDLLAKGGLYAQLQAFQAPTVT